MRELLEAGVHFGHQTRRWNPKMRRFIFAERGGIYIIDLTQTAERLDEAQQFLRNVAERGGTVLFVGTKKQAQDAVEGEAKRVDMPYVNHRWLGGLLTNWRTMADRIGLAAHVGDAAEVRLELLELAGHGDALLGREQIHLPFVAQAPHLVQPVDAVGHRAPVREQAAEPAVVDVRHVDALRLVLDGVLRLLLRADEEDGAAALRDVAQELPRLVEPLRGLREIDDVDAAALGEDEAAHLRVPAARLVAEVDARLQQVAHGDSARASAACGGAVFPPGVGGFAADASSASGNCHESSFQIGLSC